ncbi:MAG: zinc transporter ZupT [Ignavibacteriales bacterium]|nr:zinc transporter ZupT [Ignavibacteriales bacterium]
MTEENLLLAFLLTLFAGLSTGIGSILAFFTKQTNIKFLSLALGFSAGVMIYVSLVEIFSKAKAALVLSYGGSVGNWLTIAGFFGGIFLIGLIDKFIPSHENPHEIHKVEEVQELTSFDKKRKLLRTGLFTALAIGIHNFPEGLATFVATLKDSSIGIPIAVAIAIHNIPEGIAVSIPIFYATNNKKKAFWYSFLSGLAEPIGALVGYFILYQFMSDSIFGLVFSSVAGIMIYISIDELLPSAEKYGEHHLSIFGLIIGMIVMAISLVLFV